VQLVGDRKNTKVEHRILHLDVAAAAVKLVRQAAAATAVCCTEVALLAGSQTSMMVGFRRCRLQLHAAMSCVNSPKPRVQ